MKAKLDITRGDLVLVACPTRRNIVMVTAVQSKIWVGVLIHTSPELATDADVVLPQGTVAPYPVVLQFDLYGTFYRSQAVRVIGHVPVDDCVTGIDPYIAARKVATHLDAWRGLPIWHGSERWNYKIEQLEEELHPLVTPFWQAFKW